MLTSGFVRLGIYMSHIENKLNLLMIRLNIKPPGNHLPVLEELTTVLYLGESMEFI